MPGFVLWVVRIRVEFLVISISGDAILPGRVDSFVVDF